MPLACRPRLPRSAPTVERNSRRAWKRDARRQRMSSPSRRRTAPLSPGRVRSPKAPTGGQADFSRHDRRSDRDSARCDLSSVRPVPISGRRIAQYWENLTGSFGAGHWNEVARGAISSHALDEAQSARVLALVHMVGVDGTIACHDSKYIYWVPRPTQADPGIRLAIGVPNHPSYPSNHACISGAIGLVLDAQFPDERGRYVAMARQAGESRIYGGIHYRMDVDEGTVIARKVAARALEVGVPTDRPFVPVGK